MTEGLLTPGERMAEVTDIPLLKVRQVSQRPREFLTFAHPYQVCHLHNRHMSNIFCLWVAVAFAHEWR